MVNTAPAVYTVQLGATVTPEVAGELSAWGAHRGVSMATVTRDCIEFGLPKLRAKWEREHGPMPAALLAAHIAKARARGEQQVSTRRKYDRTIRDAAASVLSQG